METLPCKKKKGYILHLTIAFFVIGASTILLWNKPSEINANKSTHVQVNSSTDISHELRVAWLMSFPNSGTTFTEDLVLATSKMSISKNNCEKSWMHEHGKCTPVFSDEPSGPYLYYTNASYYVDIPKHYILSKTHCDHDGPQKEISKTTPEQFKRMCRYGSYNTPAKGKTREKKHVVKQNIRLLGKAVHLIRDPYDNIVARFHMDNRLADKRHHGKYPNNPEGFQAWCSDLDDRFLKKQSSIFQHLPTDSVLCLSEFFRYVQWHNNAFEVTQSLHIPTHLVRYEEYGNDYSNTVSSLLQFLELTQISNAPEFRPSDYSEYYSENQRRAIHKYMKKQASRETWNELKRNKYIV